MVSRHVQRYREGLNLTDGTPKSSSKRFGDFDFILQEKVIKNLNERKRSCALDSDCGIRVEFPKFLGT